MSDQEELSSLVARARAGGWVRRECSAEKTLAVERKLLKCIKDTLDKPQADDSVRTFRLVLDVLKWENVAFGHLAVKWGLNVVLLEQREREVIAWFSV